MRILHSRDTSLPGITALELSCFQKWLRWALHNDPMLCRKHECSKPVIPAPWYHWIEALAFYTALRHIAVYHEYSIVGICISSEWWCLSFVRFHNGFVLRRRHESSKPVITTFPGVTGMELSRFLQWFWLVLHNDYMLCRKYASSKRVISAPW